MPKIPTFTTEATITEQVGSVKSNIQMSLNQTIGATLAPLTKELVDYKVKQKDFENKTEALRLENDFIRDMQSVYDEAGNLQNEEQAQSILKNKSNTLIQKYSNLASNKNTQNLFNNYALSEVQKGIARTSTAVQNNTLIALDTLVNDKKSRLMITALDTKGGFDYDVLGQDLENLYSTHYKGKVSDAILNRMILGIPNEIKFLEAEKMISESPRQALSMLMNEKDFEGLNYESRKILIEKAKITIAPMIKLEYDDHIAKIAKGKESSFDMKTASLVLPTKTVNEMIAAETLNKDRAANNAVLLNSPLSTTNEIGENFIKEGYDLHGEIKGQENELYIKNIIKEKKEALKSDPVGFIKTFDNEIELAYQKLESETDPILLKNKKSEIIEMVIKKQRDLEIPESSIRVASNEEIEKIKTTLTDPETSAQDKMNFIMFTQDMYGNENMGKVLNQLTDLKLPSDYMVALSTNSMELKKDIFSSSTQDLQQLENLVKDRIGEGEKFNSIKKKLVKEMESYENVLEIQPEGSIDKTELIKNIEDTIYKAALYRIKYKQMDMSEAVTSASKEFLRDYIIPASETYMIPIDINGKRTNPILLEQKLEAVLLHIETTDYIDKFMGEDGYMHFAKFAGVENLTEEQVRNRVLSTIKNNKTILNNKDLTGAIVYADFANGKYPIVNAKGDKIEIYFTPTENKKGIMSTELKYPVTGEDIILVDESDGLDYLDSSLIIDENQNIGEESITLGSAVDTVGNLTKE
jgi:predicted CopG family antitoxin